MRSSKNREFRCFGGVNIDRILGAFLLINIPGFIFHIFTAKDLVEEFGAWIFIISIFLQILTTILMLVTGLSDPGVVPKNYFDKNALK